MKFHAYQDYDQYRQSQITVNHRKLKINPYLHQTTLGCIKYIIKYIKLNRPDAWSGICHAVRNGWEVQVFKHFGLFTIGTEISDTANAFEGVYQHDMHDYKERWVGLFDFVYCNAMDHAYDPDKCIKTWLEQLNETGLLFIEWTKYHGGGVNAPNCFSAEKDEYVNLVAKHGRVVDVLEFGVLVDDPTCTMPKGEVMEYSIIVGSAA